MLPFYVILWHPLLEKKSVRQEKGSFISKQKQQQQKGVHDSVTDSHCRSLKFVSYTPPESPVNQPRQSEASTDSQRQKMLDTLFPKQHAAKYVLQKATERISALDCWFKSKEAKLGLSAQVEVLIFEHLNSWPWSTRSWRFRVVHSNTSLTKQFVVKTRAKQYTFLFSSHSSSTPSYLWINLCSRTDFCFSHLEKYLNGKYSVISSFITFTVSHGWEMTQSFIHLIVIHSVFMLLASNYMTLLTKKQCTWWPKMTYLFLKWKK